MSILYNVVKHSTDKVKTSAYAYHKAHRVIWYNTFITVTIRFHRYINGLWGVLSKLQYHIGLPQNPNSQVTEDYKKPKFPILFMNLSSFI